MTPPIDEAPLVIKRKCQQYWNEPAPEAAEFHRPLVQQTQEWRE